MVDWYFNYLTNKTYQVKYKNNISDARYVISGVRQGGVLSPLIYILATNELSDKCKYNLVMYADDLLTIIDHNNISSINEDIKVAIIQIGNNVKSFGLKLNLDKTNIICYSKKNRYTTYNLRVL